MKQKNKKMKNFFESVKQLNIRLRTFQNEVKNTSTEG